MTPFGHQVAEVILDAGLAALSDHRQGIPRYRVVSAPTGSSKSSYSWALTAAFIAAIPNSSVVFACETVAQCDDTYRELATLVDPKDLAVWSGAHDIDRDPSDIEFKFGFVPKVRFKRDVLDRRRVVVVTHALLKNPRGENGRTYKGQPRTLRIIDERMKEVDLLDVDLGDVVKARDWAVTKFGNLSSAFGALTSLHNYLEGAWQSGREGSRKSFVGLDHDSALWFNTPDATVVLSRLPSESTPAKVIRFAQSLTTGYAFMSCFDGTAKGGCFIGYKLDLPGDHPSGRNKRHRRSC